MKRILYLFFVMASMPVWAQEFASMLSQDNIAFLRDFKITTIDGKQYEAEKLSSYQATNGRLKSLAFVNNADGEKIKLKAEEVEIVVARMTKVAKAAAISDQASKSLENAVNTDYAEIVKNNLVRFNSVAYDAKSNKKALLQLVNHGFDKKIKVYPDPHSESGTMSVDGIALTGGDIKSYFLVKGDETYKVDKNSYKKLYDEIYNGCDAMKTDAKSISFKNLCDDILKFNATCE
jgi:hypothetical protein